MRSSPGVTSDPASRPQDGRVLLKKSASARAPRASAVVARLRRLSPS